MDNTKFWIVFVVIMVVMVVGTQLYKRYLLKRFMSTLKNRDFDGFFKVADGLASKYFFPYFNRLYMKMNAYMMMPDYKKVEETFDELLSLRLNKKQNLDVSVKAFYYYIDENKKGKCKELLERIKSLGEDAVYDECKMMYDILLCDKSDYIDSMLKQLDQAEGWNKGMICYMLAVQYHNRKDKEKEKEYLDMASEELKESPYAAKINKMKQDNKS